MSREGLLEVDGVVASLLPNLMARVLLDNGQEILAMSAGRLRRHRIRLLVGNRVTVEMTPYDLSKGRINFRHKDGPFARIASARGTGGAESAPDRTQETDQRRIYSS
jgi:translation initiation factor IF-1